MINFKDNFENKIDKAEKNFIEINKTKYFDLSLHSGVMLLGHNNEVFKDILKKIIKYKFSITKSIDNKIHNKFLSIIKRYFKSANDLIYCTTGSESAIKSIRISRALNPKKSKIFLVSGGWHGSVDQTLFSSKKNLSPIPLSSGISENLRKSVKILPYNDIEKSKKILNRFHKQAACLIIEPIMGSLPLEESKSYLIFLKNYCKKKNIILIFDEIVTGIRTDKGSVQNKFKIYPDITLAGKVIGGGFPISLIIINKKINKNINKLKKNIFFGGTFSANNFSVYSSLKTLTYIDKNKDLVKKIIKNAYLIQKKLNNYISKNKLDAKVYRFDSFLRIIFTKKEIKNRIARDFLETKNKNKISKFSKFLYSKKILYPKNGIIFLSSQLRMTEIDFLIKNLSLGLKKYFQ